MNDINEDDREKGEIEKQERGKKPSEENVIQGQEKGIRKQKKNISVMKKLKTWQVLGE